MEVFARIVVTLVLLGLATAVVGLIGGILTGFINNWALKLAGAGLGMALSAIVLGVLGAAVKLWL